MFRCMQEILKFGSCTSCNVNCILREIGKRVIDLEMSQQIILYLLWSFRSSRNHKESKDVSLTACLLINFILLISSKSVPQTNFLSSFLCLVPCNCFKLYIHQLHLFFFSPVIAGHSCSLLHLLLCFLILVWLYLRSVFLMRTHPFPIATSHCFQISRFSPCYRYHGLLTKIHKIWSVDLTKFIWNNCIVIVVVYI